MQNAKRSERILILTPFGKDADHLKKVLDSEDYSCKICGDIAELIENLSEVGVILVTEEVLSSPAAVELTEALKAQPTWSAIPILTFYGGMSSHDEFKKKATHPLQEFADITFIKRPVTGQTLMNAITVALRDRRRQYQSEKMLTLLSKEILQRQKYEQELKREKELSDRAKAAAEVANFSKSQFLANMSHEIRTPIGAIMGFLDLLKSEENSKEDINNFISVIDRNSVQLLRLIDDILDLSKVEAGKMSLENIEFNLMDVLSDCASIMGFKAQENAIHFSLILETELPARVSSDPTRLRQILMNIVGNAIKFTDHGKVELRVAYDKNELKFTVIDTGRGISVEESHRLFKPFSQADNSTTRNYGGTGLGLTLTRYLAEAMGGSFVLEKSARGEGSTFIAKIHVETPHDVTMLTQDNFHSTPYLASHDIQPVLRGLRILVVEDSPDNQELFTIMLSKLGAKVDLASDGSMGLKYAMMKKYDIVLMDVQMPEMDGHQATRALREYGYETPIIALTAHAMKEERDRTKESGFTDFLTKPVKREALTAMISAYTSIGH